MLAATLKLFGRVFGKFSVLKLFILVIFTPSAMVLITIGTMQSKGTQYKVTHEVTFDIQIDNNKPTVMKIGLFGETVPRTVKNFIAFAGKGYAGYKYEGTSFHRVIKKFMIQTGDVVKGDGTGSISIYGQYFPDENFTVKHSTSGFVSMANSGKDTNGCQFFITTIATPWLDGHHVVFGKVVDGQSVVHEIEYLATDWNDRPIKHVSIIKSRVQRVKDPYMVSDDPYNLKDWLKTISLPLGLSFSIIFLFNYFLKQLDRGIIEDDETLERIAKEAEEEKKQEQEKEEKEKEEKAKELEPTKEEVTKPLNVRKRVK
ncbi:peptidyl-prolyl cis-trans isomerase B-like [Oratosquilla oratoria]|uniref:peptidyl-prolyl cis-trans isomerase B-like n=1 Tax=Oratosquilla oratoria TaxID=337810 RepID=UPI003F761F74